jgi:hypothetical protein
MIFMKFGAGVLYKKLSVKSAFHENQPTVNHTLLENEYELST